MLQAVLSPSSLSLSLSLHQSHSLVLFIGISSFLISLSKTPWRQVGTLTLMEAGWHIDFDADGSANRKSQELLLPPRV